SACHGSSRANTLRRSGTRTSARPADQGAGVVVIGAGFTGLAAAWQLTQLGIPVTVLEQALEPGGLAAGFPVAEGQTLERFYHHWFTGDHSVMDLVRELGVEQEIVLRETRTGMYYANRVHRLSSPVDLLRFSGLGVLDRLRLGLLALRARRVTDWRQLDDMTASDWLRRMAGDRVYEVVWEPLLRGKFGHCAEEISAVWIWNKLKLRGGSRSNAGREQLAYFRGGFPALVQRLIDSIVAGGGRVICGQAALEISTRDGRACGVVTSAGTISARAVIATPALPIIADLLQDTVPERYAQQLRRITYLANLCLILELDRSLSDTYWLNVNDPGFPFVGVIEHTNFEPSSSYAGRHIVYLSRYLPESDPLYSDDNQSVLEQCMVALQRMFPEFQSDWILDHHVWRARYAQPVVTRGYAGLIPDAQTPLPGCFIASMAQIHPEDRGTNYAIREGREIARQVAETLEKN
ncbi:MAG: NAD(P)/FAD-dependent oxidoreductase, partial [Chromatocurvus sp.]